jgi:hypothetical protein
MVDTVTNGNFVWCSIIRISRHIKNALSEEEINSQRNLRKTQIANSDKWVYLYDLDVIISVGYRVKSIRGVIFRKWATKVLKDYLIKGYVINEERSLKLCKTNK